MIFDIKMEFTRKVWLVAIGHVMDLPTSSTHSSVVARDSVRIVLTLAALDNCDVEMADVGNAYLYAPTTEKVLCILKDGFGPENKGKTAIIVRALYGLKSSGCAWRKHFAETLYDMHFFADLSSMFSFTVLIALIKYSLAVKG